MADDAAPTPAAVRRRAASQVFVTDLDSIELTADDAHHLGRVLRLQDGESVCAADGRGGWRMCRWRRTGSGRAAAGRAPGDRALGGVLEPDGPIGWEPLEAHDTEIGFAPVKGDRPEWVVQKLTELGVDRITILQTARSVVRWDDERRDRQIERFRRVAREAAQQSRRLSIPDVDSGSLRELLASGAVLAEPEGRALAGNDRRILIGPEGGWAPEELVGAEVVDLGPNVLRGETAAVVAGTLVTALRVGLVRPSLPSSP